MRKTAKRQPRATRMTTPGYGFEGAKSAPGKKFPWSRVERLIKSVRNYWIGTCGPDGRPHSAPVWAIWLDGVLYFSTGDESRKARNIAKNPEITVHPEIANEAVILDGVATKVSGAAKLKPVWKVYKKKYDWDVEGYSFYALRPRVVYSFKEDLPNTATRWVFSADRKRKRG
jgi:nitroimidazol reductase NimA-like FMN-containing flavoprotein (pyridoxamine 5'-phosphate oxidase superfamily)